MIQNFYQTRSLDRQLDKLRRSDKKGVIATRRAEQVMNMLMRDIQVRKQMVFAVNGQNPVSCVCKTVENMIWVAATGCFACVTGII